MLSDNDHIMCEWSDIFWPDKSFFIHEFFSNYPHKSAHSYTITSHYHFVFLPFCIGIPESEIIGKPSSEFEDISYFGSLYYCMFCRSTFYTYKCSWYDNLFIVSLFTFLHTYTSSSPIPRSV